MDTEETPLPARSPWGRYATAPRYTQAHAYRSGQGESGGTLRRSRSFHTEAGTREFPIRSGSSRWRRRRRPPASMCVELATTSSRSAKSNLTPHGRNVSHFHARLVLVKYFSPKVLFSPFRCTEKTKEPHLSKVTGDSFVRPVSLFRQNLDTDIPAHLSQKNAMTWNQSAQTIEWLGKTGRRLMPQGLKAPSQLTPYNRAALK